MDIENAIFPMPKHNHPSFLKMLHTYMAGKNSFLD